MLALSNVVIHFDGKEALNIASLSIKAGEKVAIVGPSGSGKSTLVHHIYELLRPSAALCSQRQGLVENLSVYHNIFMGALNRHSWFYNLINLALPFKQPLNEIGQIMDRLELSCPLTQPTASLSGGQRQRVALGRALFQQQAVFIGDEPFSALDPIMGQRLLAEVLSAHDTVIMVLHDVNMALENFDRIIGLQAGQKILDCPVDELNFETLQDFYQQAGSCQQNLTAEYSSELDLAKNV
ncbi:phosphonates import ATP-binding protein PhnC 1 [Shewanella sairae]|uniref:Phosphonates import ATP-binding protein PhnC 1 n=1 Tax=Shewanella sairae TaxID=190310 RepID=A0ABQ4PMT5_9GAMM|nr:ATP-binding cassette domain-containing protein [Shewanella sairae]MCL1129441.1 ATP-binding cassette domain-containing protein [Shewanella sairae]GIU49504.1 phosphonates import ATP-binding protein PhnC 1 [Shewanella sairae]